MSNIFLKPSNNATNCIASNINFAPTGNIISHEWYQKITTKSGKPDLTSISILSEIVYWYRPKAVTDKSTGLKKYISKFLGDLWQTSYAHFEKKFNFSHETIRRSLVKLEQLGLIKREFREVSLRGQGYNNVLFIHLNLQNEALLAAKTATTKLHQNVSNNHFFKASNVAPSPQIVGDHNIDIKNKNRNKKDRSIESNFYEISFVQNSKQPYKIPKVVKKNFWALPKQLKDFYPLSQEDATTLQSGCGREFSLNAMNEILKNMSKRLNDRLFKSKRAFLSYMSKAFQYEMRDAVKISNENFKIRANQTNEEIETKQQEEYLAEIEYNLQVSPEWHFKKKIAAILDRTKAYDFLKNYRSSAVEEGVFKIYLNKYIELSSMDRTIILQQVKATHERFDLSTTEFQTIETIEIIMPEKKSIAEQIEQTNNHLDDRQLQVTSALTGIWGNVRKILMSYYKEKGAALDRSWFSKLTAIEDTVGKSLTLTSPTRFICCYIQKHYQHLIRQFCEEKGYRLEIY